VEAITLRFCGNALVAQPLAVDAVGWLSVDVDHPVRVAAFAQYLWHVSS
tara:strand:+ start:1615 stop:1761 length:147 start_codon:yes stop_codon:yes gene_type:complete